MSNSIIATHDTVTPDLQWKAQKVGNSEQLNKVVGAAGAKVFREHFVKRAQVEKNPFGAPSRFWAKMRRLTNWKADSAKATVILSPELRLKFKGGIVRPTGGRKALAIPASRRTYGKTPRMFRDLIFIPPDEMDKAGKYRGELRFPGGTYRTRTGGVSAGSLRAKSSMAQLLTTSKSVSLGQGLGERAFTLWAFTKHKPKPETLPNRETLAAAIRRAVIGYIRTKGGNA